MLKILFLIGFMAINFGILRAQEFAEDDEVEYSRVYMTEIDLIIADPQGRIDNRFDNPGIGISAGFLFQMKAENPLFLGLQLQYIHLDAYRDYFTDFTATDPYEVESTTTNNLFRFSVNPRFYSGFTPFGLQSYIEGNIGGTIIYTTTSTSAVDFDETSFNINESDFAVSYGIGMGLSYAVNDLYYINAKFIYQSSLSTSYYYFDDNSLPNNPRTSLDFFTKGNGTIPQILYSLGMTFVF